MHTLLLGKRSTQDHPSLRRPANLAIWTALHDPSHRVPVSSASRGCHLFNTIPVVSNILIAAYPPGERKRFFVSKQQQTLHRGSTIEVLGPIYKYPHLTRVYI